MFKELIYTGLGAAVLMKERVDEELKKLEDQGKIKSEDAKSFVESLQEQGQAKEDEFKELLKEQIKEVIDELGLVTKQDLEQLKNN
jgi:polyhydroxyalkanoate synthesis regulator phasin